MSLDRLSFGRWPLSTPLLLLAGLAAHLTLYASRQQAAGATLATWLLALLFFLWAIWSFDREQPERQPLLLHWDRYDTWSVGLLMLLALALRVVNLEHGPLALHNDEAVVGVRALNLVGQPLAPFWKPDEMSLTNVWYYLQAPFILLFGRNATGVRMMAVFTGVLTIPTAYLFVRLLFTQTVAIGATFLLATYHFHIHFSRLGLAPILDPFFGTLALSTLVIGLRTRRPYYFALTGVILGIALNFYTGARLFIPLTALLGLSWLLIHRPWRTWLQPATWFPWLLVGLGLLIAAAPQLQAAILEPRFFLIRVTAPSALRTAATTAQQEGWSQSYFWFEQLRHALLSFYFYPESGYQGFYDKEHPLMRGLAAWLMAGGSLLALWRWRQWRYQVLILWYLLTALVGGMLMADPAAQQRFVTLTVVACLLVALALDQARRWAIFWWPAARGPSEVVAIVLYLNLAVVSVYGYYFQYLPNGRLYGTLSSQMGTALARYLQDQPADTQVWFVGKGMNGFLHSHIPRYLAPQVQLNDLTTFLTATATPPPPVTIADKSAPTLFVTAFFQPQERAAIQQQYPGGVEVPINWPGSDAPVLTVYRFE